MYKVLLKANARKELDTLPREARGRIVEGLDDLVSLGIHARHVKKLQPPIGGYRMRVGAYRILFDRKDEIVVVHKISRRSTRTIFESDFLP